MTNGEARDKTSYRVLLSYFDVYKQVFTVIFLMLRLETRETYFRII